jgi:hypothetical protein
MSRPAALISPLHGPRAVTDADFPRDADLPTQAAFMVNWAVLAPSVLNTQPWRFEVEGGTVRVFADPSRHLRHLDPDGREMAVSLGAAVFNLRLAMRHYGFGVAVERVPDPAQPTLYARVSVDGAAPATEAEDDLFRAIKRRQTSRHPFATMDVPVRVLEAFTDAAEAEGARLHILTETVHRENIAELVADAVRAQGADDALRDEIDAWLRPTRDPRADGVPDEAQGVWDRLSYLGTDASLLARKKRDLARESPALLVIATDEDTPEAWLRAGEALQHVLLIAAHHDMAASYLNQPTEVPALRKDLAAIAGPGYPHVLLRVGYVAELPGTPRRSVLDVIDET